MPEDGEKRPSSNTSFQSMKEKEDALKCDVITTSFVKRNVVSTSFAGMKDSTSTFAEDLCAVLRLGWPNSVSQVLTFLPGLIMLYFLSDNPDHVGAAGMGFMFSNVVGLSLIMGSGAGAQPLISQAFGAENFTRCGDLLQRQLAIHVLLVLVVAMIWLSGEQILLLMQQPPEIAALAGEFLRWRVAALPALAVKEDLTYFLVSQRNMRLPMLACIASSIFNVAAFAVLVPYFGFVGAPLAYTMANIMQGIILLAGTPYILAYPEAWPQWNLRVALTGWSELLKLALPGGALILCEWWGWEMNLFFAGLLCDTASEGGCVQLNVYPIVANTMVIAFMPNFGFSIAAGALIGNAIGNNDPQKARRIAHISLGLATIIGGFIGSGLFFGRHHWGYLFSDDTDVLLLTAKTLPAVCLYIFLDNVGPGSLINILRGMNYATTPAILTFIAFYGIGIPVGLWLTFERTHENWDIIGLWLGLALGMFFMVFSLLFFLFVFADWKEAARIANSKALRTRKLAKGEVEKEDIARSSREDGLLAADDVELS